MSRKPVTPKPTTPRPVKLAKIPTPAADFDGAWKFILREQLPRFLEFFWNSLYQQIDWNRGFEFLDKELRRVARGRRGNKSLGIVDILVKIWLLDGTTKFLLLHIEFQAQKDETLEERMFIYNSRAKDLYRVPVRSMAILADTQGDWRPHEYLDGGDGSVTHFTFHTQKLLDWKGHAADLEAMSNPFGLAVLAHLQTQATKGDAEYRYRVRLRLSRLLFEKGWSRAEIEHFYEFIEWLLVLPEAMEDRYVQEPVIRAFEEEIEMMDVEMEKLSPYHRKVANRRWEAGKEEGIEIGEARATRNLIRRIGGKRFGPLDISTEERLNAITSLEELEQLADRLTEVESWVELLTP